MKAEEKAFDRSYLPQLRRCTRWILSLQRRGSPVRRKNQADFFGSSRSQNEPQRPAASVRLTRPGRGFAHKSRDSRREAFFMHFSNRGRPTPSLVVAVQCRYRVCLLMIPSRHWESLAFLLS